jgi:hypothetical protein
VDFEASLRKAAKRADLAGPSDSGMLSSGNVTNEDDLTLTMIVCEVTFG